MKTFHALALACAFVVTAPALAQEKAATKPGFALRSDKPIRIIVFRPTVKVGSQAAGGAITPNAEWTANARKLLSEAIVAAHPGGASDVVFMPEMDGDDALLLADYQALFGVVADTVLQHRLFKGDRLPTKKTGFEYTLGSGVSRLAEKNGGDYGLFITTNDAFGSTGRKMLQIFAMGVAGATGFGAGITSGEHIGYAGLIDLKTGDLVWINADYKMGGDVREADGAAKRVRQLLEDFPAPAAAATGVGQ